MNPKDIMTDAIHNFHPQYQQYTQYSSGKSRYQDAVWLAEHNMNHMRGTWVMCTRNMLYRLLSDDSGQTYCIIFVCWWCHFQVSKL
jgi:hypothetical protein